MRVLVTGATGYVGSHLVPALVVRGHTVRALVRNARATLPPGVERAVGDATDVAAVSAAMEGVDAVVHLVGIIDEQPSKGVTFERVHVDGTRTVAYAARDAGVRRFVHMSANGASPHARTGYQATKGRAEEVVRGAGFDHLVIFQPSTLFGDPGPDHPEFAKRLWETLVRPFPVLPIFGNGRYALQPIGVQTVADAFADAVGRDDLAGQTFVAAGAEAIPYRDVLRRIAEGGGIAPKPTVPVPIPIARLGVNTVGRVGLLPISPDQFEMLVAGNTGSPVAFAEAFGGLGPPFNGETLGYLRRY